MKYSLTLLALGATSISALALSAPNAQSSSSCDALSLAECAQPLTQQVLDCGNTDVECLCTTVSDLVSCYNNFCPGQAPPEIVEATYGCKYEGYDVANPTGGSWGEEETSAVETETLVDPESTATSTARVTKTTSQDDSEETSSAEPQQNDETVTSTRRQSGTQTPPAPTQSTGAAQGLVAPVGGLLAAAIGVVALL